MINRETMNKRGELGARGKISPTKFENYLLAPTKFGKLLTVALTKFVT